MSLVGNLEDLSLGDILQIISLSQKTGVLVLESGQGSGRILFKDGLVESACVKGGPTDLQSLLVDGEIIDPAGFEACSARAADAELGIVDALIGETDLTEERLESLVLEAVEAAVFEMFSWLSGDFSFDVRPGSESEDPQLILKAGANAQYLAMEGMRLLDESRHASGGAAPAESTASASETAATEGGDETASSESAFHSLFGNESLETDEDAAAATAAPEDAHPFAELIVEDEPPIGSATLEVSEEDADARTAPDLVAARAIEQEAPVRIELSPAELEAIRNQPVVAIEPDVSGLEWVKSAIGSDFVRVHVFQKAEQGLARIRQYMIRGEFPVVMISTAVEIDPLSGIHGLGDFVKRLKSQASRIRVIGIQEAADQDTTGQDPGIPALDATLSRPSPQQVREWDANENADRRAAFAERLQATLAESAQRASVRTENAPAADAKSEIRRLRDMTERLQAASSRGEILPAVLAFAAEHFARAAILVARDQEIFAVAGHGIEALEVDPLGASQSVSVPAHEEGWIRTAVESGKPLQSAPQTEADRSLLERLGGLIPEVAYLGPISSGGGVVAVLYGDAGETGRPLPDASGLEVVLHHAGVALDRAALERARLEADR